MTILSPNRQSYAESMKRVRNGEQDTAVYLLSNDLSVPSDDIAALWEHAVRNSEELEPYIFTSEDIIDQSDDQQAALKRQVLENIRYEKKVIYGGREGNTEEFPCMVHKVENLDGNMDDSCYLHYIPLDDSSYNIAKSVPLYEEISSVFVKSDGYNQMNVGCIKLAQATDELVLYHRDVFRGVELMMQNNIPTWIYFDKKALWNLNIPALYKLEIYIDEYNDNSLLEKVHAVFKDRCERLEIAQWDSELDDYEWYIDDDPDTNYLDTVDTDDIEDEGEVNFEPIQEEPMVEDVHSSMQNNQSTPVVKKSFEDYLENAELPDGYIVTKNGVWVEKEDDNGKIKKIRISNGGILISS